MNSETLFIGSLITLLVLSFGTVGFSMLELEQRSAEVNVVANDPNDHLVLEPGTSSVVETNSAGVLEINLADQLGANGGVNPKSRLEIGDATNSEPVAFNATNTYDKEVNVNLRVRNIQTPGDGSGNNTGEIYLYQNGNEYQVTGTDTVPQITIDPRESATYSLHFDTSANIGTATPYSADLIFQVSSSAGGSG